MATALEVAKIAWHILMSVFSVAAITVFVLVVKGKLKLPEGPLPRRWQVAFIILAVLMLAGTFI